MKKRVLCAAAAAFFAAAIAAGAQAQNAAPPDPRTAAQTIKALSALVDLREAELRAISSDMAGLDRIWRAEFDGWCAGRPACGLDANSSPKPAETEPEKPAPAK